MTAECGVAAVVIVGVEPGGELLEATTRGQRSCCYRRLRYAGSDRMRRPCSCQTVLVTPRYVMTSSVLSVELVSVAYDRMKD